MKDPNRNVVYMLWLVVAVVIIGSVVAGMMLMRKTDELNTSNSELTSHNNSLREQLRQLRNPTPTPGAPLPTFSNGSPSPSPAASSGPSKTPTPVPTASPASNQ